MRGELFPPLFIYMNYKLIFITTLICAITNILVWIQLNAQFKWDWFRDNYFILALFGFPISYLFIYTTKWYYDGFDGLIWPGRMIAFGASIIVFSLMTSYILGEGLTTKTIISIVLSAVLMGVQVLM